MTNDAKHQIVIKTLSQLYNSTSCTMKQQLAFTWRPTVLSHDRGTLSTMALDAKDHIVKFTIAQFYFMYNEAANSLYMETNSPFP